MKKFKENSSDEIEDIDKFNKSNNEENRNSNNSELEEKTYYGTDDYKDNKEDRILKEENEEEQFKVIEDLEKEEKDPYINSSMKRFRLVIGMIIILLFIVFSFTSRITKNYIDNLSSGIIKNVNEGEILSKNSLKLEAKDATIEIVKGYGNLEISIWNFADKEDNDYVQVFIDGVEQGPPFSIRHKPAKISVPDKAVIQVKGIRDGSNNGITYAVYFNKTGDTYLNTTALNSMNTYTIISD